MRLWFATVCGLGLWGCAGRLPRTSQPRDPVTVESVQVRFPSEDRAEFGLALGVDNPEGAPGAINGVEWEVWLSGRRFAAGRASLAEPLPADHRELWLELPVVAHALNLVPGAVSLDVGVRGGLDVQVGGNAVRLPFARTLVVTAPARPTFDSAEAL